MISVLVLDDNDTFHEIMKHYAQDATEFQLFHAVDLEEGKKIIRSESIDIVLLDNKLLPIRDFTESAPVIRDAGYRGPIAVMSSDISDEAFNYIDHFQIVRKIDKDEFNIKSVSDILRDIRTRWTILPRVARFKDF